MSTSSSSTRSSSDTGHHITPGHGPSPVVTPVKTPNATKKAHKRATCAVCGEDMIAYNLKRHIMLRHKGIYDESLGVADIFSRAGFLWSNIPGPASDNGNDQIQSRPPPGKAGYELCGARMRGNNLKRHIKLKHPSVYAEGESVKEMFAKATPFPDLSGGEEEGEDENESTELALGHDQDESGEDIETLYEDEEHSESKGDVQGEDHTGKGESPLVETKRKGWMSFGRVFD